MTAGEIVARLEGARKTASGWEARCPAHDDRRASLSVAEGAGGRVLVRCHAGCDLRAILDKLGLSERDLFSPGEAHASRGRIVATYPYVDEDGRLLFEVVRFDPKDFRQRRPDGAGGWIWNLGDARRVLFRLPRVVGVAGAGGVAYVVEGEKDVLALEALGLVATCNPGGAGKWRPEYADPFRGFKGAVILPDRDEPGRRHAQDVARSLHSAGVPVKVIELPDIPAKGDVSDWLAAGGTKEKLLELAKAAPRWQPSVDVPEPADDDDGPRRPSRQYPPAPRPSVFYGPIGDLVRAIEPHTEADPVAVLIQALVYFGNVIGRGPHLLAEARRHHTNLFVCIVAATSKGRKGSSLAHVERVFRVIDELWLRTRKTSGLSSGEGLIWTVRDPIEKKEPVREGRQITGYQTVIADEGVSDKRVLFVEEELGGTLAIMGRQGNSLSPTIRSAWDTGTLNTAVKNNPARATDAHVSIVGHVTRDELIRNLNDTEKGNGFANRFLWLCAQRSKTLPFGGNLQESDLQPIVQRIHDAVDFCRKLGETRLTWNDAAADAWRRIYPTLSEGKPGLLGSVTSRAEAIVIRSALLYALADCSREIQRPHLDAAVALWQYSEDSARFIFGDALGDPLADEILAMLRRAGDDGMTRTAIRDHFGRNKGSGEIGPALGLLAARGLARSEPGHGEGAGRRPEVWRAVTGKYDIDDRNDQTQAREPDSVVNVVSVVPSPPAPTPSTEAGELLL